MTRVTKAIYEITLGGESTGGDLVVARSPLVASLLVASLPGGEVTVNRCICSILGWSPGHGNFPRMVALAVIMLIFFLTGTVVAAIV